MATTAGIINASSFGLYIDPSTPALLTDRIDLSISFKEDLRDTTTADSGGFEESAEGMRSGEIAGSVYLKPDSANNIDELMTAFLAKTKLKAVVKTTNADDPDWSADCYIFNLGVEAGVEDSVKVSFTVKVTDEITYTA